LLVSDADVIVTARVWRLTDAPAAPSPRGRKRRYALDWSIRFGLVEVLKGEVQFTVDVSETLTNHVEMNDLPVPYVMVRPSGRAGA
jgi:hypothetical protein